MIHSMQYILIFSSQQLKIIRCARLSLLFQSHYFTCCNRRIRNELFSCVVELNIKWISHNSFQEFCELIEI